MNASKCVHAYPQKFRNFRRTSAQAESSRIRSRGGTSTLRDTRTCYLSRAQRAVAQGKRKREKPVDYCNASNKRVIVRFKSLSDRRNSSILLIECSTVV